MFTKVLFEAMFISTATVLSVILSTVLYNGYTVIKYTKEHKR